MTKPYQAERVWLRVVGACLLLAAAPASFADRLVLISGRDITGVIESESRERITIQTAEGRVSFPRSGIRQVIREKKGNNDAAASRFALESGDLIKAIALTERATDREQLRTELDRQLVANSPELLKRAGATPPDDVNRLHRYITERATTVPELNWLLARFYAQRMEYNLARQLLAKLPPSFFQLNLSARSDLRALSEKVTADLLEKSRTNQAIDWLTAVSTVAPQAVGENATTMVYLGEAERMANNGETTAAIRVVAEKVKPLAPALAFNTAKKIAEGSRRFASIEDQVAAHAEVEMRFPEVMFQKDLVPLIRTQAELLASRGFFDEATSAALRLSAIDADLGAVVEHQVEFERRKSDIAAEDVASQYKLGIWARERALTDAAAQQFKATMHDPLFAENARLQLELIQQEREAKGFEEVTKTFQSRDYKSAMDAAEAFRRQFPASPLAKKAGALIELAKYHQQQSKQQRPLQADALLQQAERLYFQDRFREAEELVTRVEIDFADTPVRTRAKQLRARMTDRVRKAVRGTQMQLPVNLNRLKDDEVRSIVEGTKAAQ